MPAAAARVLAAAAAVHVGLFAVHLAGQLRQAGKGRSAGPPGAGAVVRGDGVGYYAWLRSPLIDGDWAFDNEFDEHNATGSAVPPKTPRTPAGRRPNHWPVGPACAWAAAVVPGHLALSAGGGRWAADGYTAPYQLLVGLTTLGLALAALGLTYGIARHFADPHPAAVAAAVVTLATPLVYYGTVETSMAHGPGAAALAAFVWTWLRGFGGERVGRWAGLGVLLGVAALMRYQLATYGVLLAGEAAWLLWRTRRLRPAGLLLVAAAGAVVGFAPQMAAWKVVYGSWLVEPLPLARNWLGPDLAAVLASADRGLFYWTPATLVAAVGLRAAGGRRVELQLLAAALAVQVYSLAAVSGPGVFLGSAFGYRHLAESCVVLAPGLAVLLGPGRRLVAAGGCLLVAWNLLLIGAYRHGFLPADAGAAPGELVAAAARFAGRRPVELALTAAGVAALTVAALRKERLPGEPAAEEVPPPAPRLAA